MKDKTVVALVLVLLLVFSLYVLYVILNPVDDTVPDQKGFIPVGISFGNNLNNITLPIGSTSKITTTLTSNLDIKATITLTPSFVALGELGWFSIELETNSLTLEPFGVNSTILTISIAKDTPPNIQPDTLRVEMSSLDYPSVRLWDGAIELFVEST